MLMNRHGFFSFSHPGFWPRRPKAKDLKFSVLGIRYAIRLAVVWFSLAACVSAAEITEDDFIDLIYAIHLGDADGVITGLDKGIPVDQIDGDRRTLMWHAITADQPQMIPLLLEQGYEWRQQLPILSETVGYYYFELALRSSEETLQAFLSANGRIHGRSRHLARARPELLQYSVERGIIPGIERQFTEILEWAITHHNHKMVEFLLQQDWGPINPSVVTVAAYYGNEKAIDALIEKGISLESPGRRHQFFSRVRGFNFGRPLVSAVMAHNLPILERLLEAGADPTAEDNAILWADALGNKAIYDRLIAAGAKRPEPYEFLRHPRFRPLADSSEETEGTDRDSYSWELSAILNTSRSSVQRPESEGQDSSLRIGIIQQSEGLEGLSALLETRLSEEAGIDLVDRSQLRTLVDERLLQSGFSTATANRIGSLMGADALLYLRTVGNNHEARVVSTSTGLILSTHYTASRGDLNAWIDEVAADGILGNLHRLHLDPGEAILLSIPRIGTTGSDGFEGFAEQLGLALAYRLGSEPGVFLLDRHELQRLHLEQGLTQEASDFFRSAWIVDGFLDQGANASQLTLSLRLQRGTGGKEERTTIEGSSSDPRPLIEAVAETILERSLTAPTAGTAEAEGRIFLQRGLEANRAGLYTYALASLRTASALGVRNPQLREASVQAGIRSLMDIRNTQGQAQNLHQLEFLTWPSFSLSRFAYDSEVERLIDIAHLLLDQTQDYLQQNRSNIRSDISELNLIPLIFYNANFVLELLTPLSDRDHHGHRIASLRARLNSLSSEAIQWAGEVDLPLLQGELLIMRFRSIPYWTDDEAQTIRLKEEVLEQIHQPELKAFIYPFFNALQGVYEAHAPRQRSAYALTFWHRYLDKMRQSEFPNVRLLAHSLAISRGSLPLNWQEPVDQMEQWRSLMEAWETDQRQREQFGDFGYFTPNLHHGSMTLRANARDSFNIRLHDAMSRFQTPQDATFSVPRQILPEGRPGLQFDSTRHLLPEFALDEGGLERDEAVIRSRLQRLADHWPKIQPLQGVHSLRRPPHELVPESHLRAFSSTTLTSLSDQAEQIHAEIRNAVSDTTLLNQLYNPLFNTEPTGVWGRSLLVSLFQEIERRESVPEVAEVETSLHPFISDTTFFIPTREFPEAISDQWRFRGEVRYFGNYDQSLWVGMDYLGVLQFDANGKFEQLLQFPTEVAHANLHSVVASPERVVAVLHRSGGGRGPDQAWFAIYNRGGKTWEVLEYEGRPLREPGTAGNHLLLSLQKDQAWTAGRGGSTGTVADSGYRIIKHRDLATGDEQVLVDTRRVPPVSPLDQQGSDPFMPQINHLENDEFLVGRRHIIHLQTGDWRRANRGEIDAGLSRQSDEGNLPNVFFFRGVSYQPPMYRQNPGLYVISTSRTPPEVVSEQQRIRPDFTGSHQLEVPFPYRPESMEPLPEEWTALNQWIRSPDPSQVRFLFSRSGAILLISPIGLAIYPPEQVEAIMEHAWDQAFPLAENP